VAQTTKNILDFRFQILDFFQLKIHNLQFAILLALCSLLLISCSDTPNNVGNNFFDNVIIDSTHLFADSAITVRKRIAGGYKRILFGEKNGYRAVSIVKFDIPKNLDSATIFSAVVHLKMNYRMDTSGMFLAPVKTYKMDSVNLSAYRWFDFASSTYDSLFSNPIVVQQMDSVFSFPLDTAFVSTNFYSKIKNGILVQTSLPVFGCYSFNHEKNLRPELKLQYKFPSDTSQRFDSVSINTGVALFVANRDSVTSDSLFVQAGIADKVFLRFGNFVSSFPRYATIFQARLILKTTTSPFVFEQENSTPMIVQQLRSSSTDSMLGSAYENIPTTNYSTLTFDVKKEVQSWINGSAQWGLLISAQTESNSFDRFSFYGNTAADSLRPRLEILFRKK
jgi:hypothetical protein